MSSFLVGGKNKGTSVYLAVFVPLPLSCFSIFLSCCSVTTAGNSIDLRGARSQDAGTVTHVEDGTCYNSLLCCCINNHRPSVLLSVVHLFFHFIVRAFPLYRALRYGDLAIGMCVFVVMGCLFLVSYDPARYCTSYGYPILFLFPEFMPHSGRLCSFVSLYLHWGGRFVTRSLDVMVM